MVLSIVGLDKMRIDDPVGAISVHGTRGIWGLMAVLITTDGATLTGQLTGLATILGFTFAAALVVWFVIKLIFGIRLLTKTSWWELMLRKSALSPTQSFLSSIR